jgi:hypothetical protein
MSTTTPLPLAGKSALVTGAAGRDDRQRTEGRDASQVPERLERQGQYHHGGERPT